MISNKNINKRILKSVSLSTAHEATYEEFILNTRKVTVPLPFILSSPQKLNKKAQKISLDKKVVKIHGKTPKKEIGRSPVEYCKTPIVTNSHRFNMLLTGQSEIPLLLKSAVKKTCSPKWPTKKVHFSTPPEARNILADHSENNIVYNNFKIPAKKILTNYTSKEIKKSTKKTLSDLIKFY